MEVDNSWKGNNILSIIFMIPTLRNDNKRIYIRIFFDFNLDIMKMRYESSYIVSIVELINMISTTICIDIQQDIEVTNIELSTNITKEKPNLELLYDVVINNPRLYNIFSLKKRLF